MITATVIANAAKAAQAGQEKEVSFLDDGREGVAGLCIRVKGNAAHWYIRIKGHKASIAELSAFKADDLPRLRELSTTIKGAWKAGRSQAAVKLIISEFLRQPKTVRSAKVAENEAAVVIDGAWTWRVLRDKYLEYAREAKSEKTYSNFRSALGAVPGGQYEGDYKTIMNVAVANITQEHLLDVRNNVLRRGGMVGDVPKGLIRSAEMAVAGMQAAFIYGMDKKDSSGLRSNPMIEFPIISRPTEKKPEMAPEVVFGKDYLSLKQIYKLIYVWLPKQKQFMPEARLAFTMQALTGQRIETVTSAFTIQFRRVFGTARYIWAIGPDKMGAYRVIPLPDYAALIAHQAIQQRKLRGVKSKRSTTDLSNNYFLFPQTRVRKKGDRANRHISNHTVNDIWREARAEGGPLHKTKFASHDLRRAFVSHLVTRGAELGVEDTEALIKKITHMNEGKTSVLGLHYNLSSDDQVKFRVLKLWQDLILNAYGEHRAPPSSFFEFEEEDFMLGMMPDEYRDMVIEDLEDEEARLQYRPEPESEYV